MCERTRVHSLASLSSMTLEQQQAIVSTLRYKRDTHKRRSQANRRPTERARGASRLSRLSWETASAVVETQPGVQKY